MTVDSQNLQETIEKYKAVLRRIAEQSTEHFAVSLAQAALNGWDARPKKE